jgi:outer membrane lipase/esterase
MVDPLSEYFGLTNKGYEVDMNRPSLARLIAALTIALLSNLSFAHDEYEDIVIFGDSLSDPGNAFFLLGSSLTPPYASLDALLIPDAPYAVGGNRFSNGATWIERLARSLELKSSAGPAFKPGAKGKRANYAVGGARARDTGGSVDLPVQVGAYLSQSASPADDETLFVVEFGGNDVRDAISALAVDPSGATSTGIVTAALTSISDNLLALYLSGARQFLLVNSPDLSLTPAIRTLDALAPGSAMAAAFISAQYNDGLGLLVEQLGDQLPGVEITLFDVYSLLHEIVATPDDFHISNATDACITPMVPPYSCGRHSRYLFWDGIHPTRTGHAIFAKQALRTLAPDAREDEHKRCRKAPVSAECGRAHAH